VVGSLTLLRIREVPGSNLDLDTGYPDGGFSWFSSVPPGSRVSSGSIVSDYGLDDRAIGVRSPAGEEDFSSSLCVQTCSGAHPASCTMGTGGPFPGG
jgi:hypothetical protein